MSKLWMSKVNQGTVPASEHSIHMTCDERNSFGSLCKLGGLAGPCLAHTDQDLATGRMSCCIMLDKRSHNIALKPDCAAFKEGSQDHFHTMDVDDVRIS